ncbi:MAG: hypothetical protein AB1420_15790 [Bacillota bacterium]
MKIALQHPHTKEKLLIGQAIASEFQEAYELISDDKVIDWIIEQRPDLCKGLAINELNWVLKQLKDFKDFLFDR